MTKEEIEKEAEEYANNLAFVFETDIVQRIVRERVRLALIDVLEPREKRIAELEKENAELKEKYVKNITDCDICDTYCNSQLTKAKELLKKVLDLKKVVTKAEEYLLLEEAEQFLKETK